MKDIVAWRPWTKAPGVYAKRPFSSFPFTRGRSQQLQVALNCLYLALE